VKVCVSIVYVFVGIVIIPCVSILVSLWYPTHSSPMKNQPVKWRPELWRMEQTNQG